MATRPIVVDAHFHHVPLSVFETLDGLTLDSEEARRLQTRNRDPAYIATRANKLLRDLDTTMRFMDDVGVDIAMLQMPSWSVAGLDVCKALNDGLARAGRDHPERFLPVATAPYIFGQHSLDELSRIKNDLGFGGISILTSHRGIRLDDESLKPYWRRVAELGLVTLVHPPTQNRVIWEGDRYNMGPSISRQYENVKCVAEVLNGVLPEFPDLRFLFSHFGGGIPSLMGRMKSWYAPPKSAGVDTSHIELPMTLREFEDFGLAAAFDKALNQCWFDMAGTGGWVAEVEHAAKVIDPGHLAFGTDYPHEMARADDARAYLDGIRSIGLAPSTQTAMLGGNVLKLFGRAA